MLKERRDTDVVANPRIATLNNKAAVIDVGENIPMPTFERNSQTGNEWGAIVRAGCYEIQGKRVAA